jgi:hypothetical protein
MGLITAALIGLSYLSFKSTPLVRDAQLSREMR